MLLSKELIIAFLCVCTEVMVDRQDDCLPMSTMTALLIVTRCHLTVYCRFNTSYHSVEWRHEKV